MSVGSVFDEMHMSFVKQAVKPLINECANYFYSKIGIAGFKAEYQLTPKNTIHNAEEVVFNKFNLATKKITFYSLFTLTTAAAFYLASPLAASIHWSAPYILTGLVGGIMQGNPDCPAQQKIEKNHPVAAFAAGALNAIGCCFMYDGFTTIAGPLLGSVMHIATCSEWMCKLESQVNNLMDLLFSSPTGLYPTVTGSCCVEK